MRRAAMVVLAVASLAGCQNQGQSVYRFHEVGRANVVNFATVLAVREVGIQGQNTGTGAAVGSLAGGMVGAQIGSGSGNTAATLAGLVVGGIAGAMAEQAAANRRGLEYTVTLENGATLTVVQDVNVADRILQPGERAMIQMAGGFQRVLPADNLPTAIRRPVGVRVID